MVSDNIRVQVGFLAEALARGLFSGRDIFLFCVFVLQFVLQGGSSAGRGSVARFTIQSHLAGEKGTTRQHGMIRDFHHELSQWPSTVLLC